MKTTLTEEGVSLRFLSSQSLPMVVSKELVEEVYRFRRDPAPVLSVLEFRPRLLRKAVKERVVSWAHETEFV